MSQVGLSIGAVDVPLAVQRIELREGLSASTLATVIATTPLPALSPSMIVGQTASVTLSAGGDFALLDFDVLGERTWTGVCQAVTLVKVEHSGVSTYRFDIVAPAIDAKSNSSTNERHHSTRRNAVAGYRKETFGRRSTHNMRSFPRVRSIFRCSHLQAGRIQAA